VPLPLPRWWRTSAAHLARQEGQGLIEYALALILVTIVVIAVLTLLSGEINALLNAVMRLFAR